MAHFAVPVYREKDDFIARPWYLRYKLLLFQKQTNKRTVSPAHEDSIAILVNTSKGLYSPLHESRTRSSCAKHNLYYISPCRHEHKGFACVC